MVNHAEELFATYNLLFYVSLGVAILGFVLAVVIFFLLDIPMVYAARSGRMAQRAVNKLNRRGSKVGHFDSRRTVKGSATGEMQKLRTEVRTGEILRPRQEAEHLGEEAGPPSETMPLSESVETAPLAPLPVSYETVQKVPSAMDVTVELKAGEDRRMHYRFEIIEELVLCDTEERI